MKMKMKATHAATVLKYVMWYLYNVPKTTIIESTYEGKLDDEIRGQYLESKLAMLCKEPLGWYGDLDTEHRVRFCRLVLEQYDNKGEFNV